MKTSYLKRLVTGKRKIFGSLRNGRVKWKFLFCFVLLLLGGGESELVDREGGI